MRTLFYSIFLISLLNILCSSLSFAEEKSNDNLSVNDFLSHQPIIRVEGDNGSGFGNLATTMRVMDRLRVLGFTGVFEFIYPADSAAAVMTLFGVSQEELDKGERNGVHFIKVKDYLEAIKKGAIKKIPLGITGPRAASFCQFSESFLPEDSNDPFCTNPANALNVEILASVTNALGPEDKLANVFYLNQDDRKYYSNENNTVILSKPTTLNEVNDYLRMDPQGKSLSLKNPGISALFTGIESQSFNIFPIYGYTLHIFWDNPENYYLNNILQVIMGARYAQLYGPDEFRKKGLVIPVFYNYEEESKKLIEIINHDNWGDFHSDILKYGMKQMGLPYVFETANLSDPKVSEVLFNLQPGHILLLSMGPLPKLVFDGLYTEINQNSWPQVREGLDTLNQLILTGKPHFRCGTYGWELGVDRIPYPALQQEMQHFYDNFCVPAGSLNASDPAIFVTLGNLIIAAHNPNSEFSKYFQGIQADAFKPENDRVKHSIEIAMKMLKGDKSDIEFVE